MPIVTSRRTLITGLISFVAAPAIVRVSSLMPIKVQEDGWEAYRSTLLWKIDVAVADWRFVTRIANIEVSEISVPNIMEFVQCP